METFTWTTISTIAEVGAWIVIAYAFMNGKIYSKIVVDQMLDLSKEMTVKLANEVKDGMRGAVKDGVMDAYAEMNGKKEPPK